MCSTFTWLRHRSCSLYVTNARRVQQAQPPPPSGPWPGPRPLWLELMAFPSVLVFICSQMTSTRCSNTCLTLMFSLALASKNRKPGRGQPQGISGIWPHDHSGLLHNRGLFTTLIRQPLAVLSGYEPVILHVTLVTHQDHLSIFR